MKKTLMVVALGLTCCCLLAMGLLGLNYFREPPAADATARMGLALKYGFGGLFLSVSGLALSLLTWRGAQCRWVRIACAVALGICAVGVLLSAFLWFKWSSL